MPKFLYTLGTLLPAAFNLGLKNKRRKKICLFGADACGKTTFLYHLKLGRAVTTIPTIGFNVESVPWIAGASGHHDGRGRGKGQEWEFEFYDVGGKSCSILFGHCCGWGCVVLCCISSLSGLFSLNVGNPGYCCGEQYACLSTSFMHTTLGCATKEDASC